MNIHPSFRLNGQQFDNSNQLIAFAKSLEDDIYIFLNHWFDNNSFIEVKTSGSTGIPKNIHLKKQAMVNSAKATGEYFKLFDKTTALLCMSAKFIAGKMMLVRALTLGWELDAVIPISNPLKNQPKNFDFCAMVPLQVAASIKDLHKIKTLIVGGGAVSDDLKNKLQSIDTNVFATYGMTETITHIAVQKLNHFKIDTKQSHYELLPNITVSVDYRGCLVIDAPLICDEKVVTNDLVELVSETQFKWLGRFDNVINSGGIKISPEVIESKIAAVMKCPFFIGAESDFKLGEKVVLVLESYPLDEEQKIALVKQLTTVLTKYEMPKTLYFIDKFILTETKKIQRKQTLDLIVSNQNIKD